MTVCRNRAVTFIAVLISLFLISASLLPGVRALATSEITEIGDSRTDRSPRMALTGDTLVAVWLALDGPNTDIFYNVRSQGAWSGVAKLWESTGNERDVALCSSGGKIYAAWATDSSQDTNGSDWDIAMSVYQPGSGWSSPVELTASNDTVNDYAPFLLPYQNGVIVLWHSIDGGEGRILMSVFTGSVSEPIAVTSDWKDMNQNPTAAFLDGTLWIAWSSADNQFTDGADLDIVAAPFFMANHTLGAAVQISDPADTEDDMYPCMLAFGDSLSMAWQTKDKTVGQGDDEDIGLAIYGGEWSIHALTSPHDTGDDTYPQLFTFDNSLWMVWQSSDPSLTGEDDWDIVVAEIKGDALGTVIVVSEGKDRMDEGGVFVRGHDALQSGEDILVVWESVNPGITDGADRDIALAVLAQPGQDKIDEESSKIYILPIFVLVGFLGGCAALLLLKRAAFGKRKDGEKKQRRKKQIRN
ncbi:MAG: hypothetical protein R6W91_00340 [Thermoplasmata archaeon]